MKLLFLTPQLPYPPHQGTTIRNFNIIKHLAPRHEIDLLSFGRAEDLESSPLREWCNRINLAPTPTRSPLARTLDTFLSPLPDLARRLDSARLMLNLDVMVRASKYDALQIEGLEMARYWLNLMPSLVSSGVLDDHNAEYVLQKSAYEADRSRPARVYAALYSLIQWKKLARFEKQVCLRVNRVVSVSEQDARELHALDPRIEPSVIPNGVDLEHYVPSDAVCAKPLAELSVVFTGKMDYRPNVDAALWFVDEVLPVLRLEIPLAHVCFVGQKPSARVQALARHPGVEVTGWVPDTRPYIADAAVYAVPLRMGGGTRLKVLEAMAMGKAIVSTTRGAEGIECVQGRDLVIADRADEFARSLAALIRDPARRRELGANARKLVEAKYDWRKIVPRFEEIYASLRR